MNEHDASTESLGSRLRQARRAAGLTQNDVALHFNIKRVSVTQWEGDKTRPESDKLPALAVLFNTSADWLLSAAGLAPEAKRAAIVEATITPGSDLVGDRDFPIYAAAMGGDGHLVVTFEAIDYYKRPDVLRNVRGGYGILIKGDSMVPAYSEGDTALVHPHLPPARDTDVVLYHRPPDGSNEVEVIIKRLVGFNDRTWKLHQYNPANTFEEARPDWPICHRVVGRYNAR